MATVATATSSELLVASYVRFDKQLIYVHVNLLGRQESTLLNKEYFILTTKPELMLFAFQHTRFSLGLWDGRLYNKRVIYYNLLREMFRTKCIAVTLNIYL